MEGFAYGIEMSLQKTKGKTTGELNYTFSSSQRKTTSQLFNNKINNGQYFPANYDRPHLLNFNLTHRTGKKWHYAAFFTYQSGRPVTIPIGQFSINEDRFIQYSNRNAHRLSDTHRLDLSATYTPRRENKKWIGSWSFGVYNVYGRKNAFSLYSRFSNNRLRTYQFSVLGAAIPFVTYNFNF